MIFTTYNLISSPDTETFMQKLEDLTGSRATYGLDTPINMNSIANGLGLETATTALNYASVDPTEVCKTIAREWIRANLGIWNLVYPGDSRIFDLMYFLEQYQLGTSTTTEVRLDYCGDPIPGGGVDILLTQINTLITSLNLTLAGIDPRDYQSPLFEIYVGNSLDSSIEHLLTIPGAGYISADLTPITDTARSVINGAPGYVPGQTAQKMDDDALIHDTFTYDPNNSQVYKQVVFQRPISDGGFDPRKNAMRSMIQAALMTADLTLGNLVAALPSIYIRLRNAYYYYGVDQQLKLEPLMSKLRSIGVEGNTLFSQPGAFVPPVTQFPQFQPYMDAINNAQLNARAAALRDVNFVQAHGDSDLSGTLTLAERINLENAVRTVMLDARQTTAQSIYAPLQADYDSWANYQPVSLVSIFNLYVV